MPFSVPGTALLAAFGPGNGECLQVSCKSPRFKTAVRMSRPFGSSGPAPITMRCPFENMATYSEDFTAAATWDKNGGSCSSIAHASVTPDGNTTADTITAVTATPVIPAV